ncbi:MAG TPA: outer membrane beta-barrel protein [Stellaceae bacterium]|nr:outer membrane beta-barrel protein [Stellaceae bacterium]
MRFQISAAIAGLGLAGAAAAAQTMPAGFYLRGDLGGGFGQNVTFTDTNPNAANCDLCGAQLPATINNSILFGGGVGYRFSPLLRGDVTVDDLPSFSLHGSTTLPAGSPSGSASFSSLVVMGNGYLDMNGLYPEAFGLWEPYVTAGVGVSWNDVGAFSGAFTSGELAGVTFNEVGSTRANFAWGAGVGVGYPITPSLTFDLGYKYLDLGELRSGTTETSVPMILPTSITASKSTDFAVHTIIASLRFAF